MMGVKRSAKRSDREVDGTVAPLFVAVLHSNTSLCMPFGTEVGGIRGPYGAHMVNTGPAFIRHEIRKMRAIMASQLSRTRLVIY